MNAPPAVLSVRLTTPEAGPLVPVARTTVRKGTLVPELPSVWPVTSWPVTGILLGVTVRVATFGAEAVATMPVSASGARNPPAVIAIPSR